MSSSADDFTGRRPVYGGSLQVQLQHQLQWTQLCCHSRGALCGEQGETHQQCSHVTHHQGRYVCTVHYVFTQLL